MSLLGQILALCVPPVNKIIEEKKEKDFTETLVFLFGCAILCTWRHVREGRAGACKFWYRHKKARAWRAVLSLVLSYFLQLVHLKACVILAFKV